jgi:hypothetical protein
MALADPQQLLLALAGLSAGPQVLLEAGALLLLQLLAAPPQQLAAVTWPAASATAL